MNLGILAAAYLPAVEAEMRRLVTPPDARLAPFYAMMQYHLGWVDRGCRPTTARTGKGIRPLLCLLCCEAAGGRADSAVPAAAAVELIHNFSLIHDDIEDRDEARHGRDSLWQVVGEAQAINAGDGLFALAHLALQGLERSRLDPARLPPIHRAFDGACLALTHGQFLDLSYERRPDISLDESLRMIRDKTAALVAAATEIGARIATDERDTVAAYRTFGEELGLAYQAVDDLLGIWGDAALTGKPVGADIAHKKKSLPVVYALSYAADADRIRSLYSADSLTAAQVCEITDILSGCGAREAVSDLAQEHYRRALTALDAAAPAAAAADALRFLAEFLLTRGY